MAARLCIRHARDVKCIQNGARHGVQHAACGLHGCLEPAPVGGAGVDACGAGGQGAISSRGPRRDAGCCSGPSLLCPPTAYLAWLSLLQRMRLPRSSSAGWPAARRTSGVKCRQRRREQGGDRSVLWARAQWRLHWVASQQHCRLRSLPEAPSSRGRLAASKVGRAGGGDLVWLLFNHHKHQPISNFTSRGSPASSSSAL